MAAVLLADAVWEIEVVVWVIWDRVGIEFVCSWESEAHWWASNVRWETQCFLLHFVQSSAMASRTLHPLAAHTRAGLEGAARYCWQFERRCISTISLADSPACGVWTSLLHSGHIGTRFYRELNKFTLRYIHKHNQGSQIIVKKIYVQEDWYLHWRQDNIFNTNDNENNNNTITYIKLGE